MHEVGIAESILHIVQRVAQDNGFEAVTGVQVEVGKFSGVEPAALEFAWGFVTKDTRADGSTLEIVRPPLMLRCELCSQEYEGNLEDLRCPHCQGENFKIIQGREMLVRAVTGDKANAAEPMPHSEPNPSKSKEL